LIGKLHYPAKIFFNTDKISVCNMAPISLVSSAMGSNSPLLSLSPFSRLSVVIPNYNYADYVGAAIESALALDWPDVEVIVVDDGSTDNSAAVISGFGNRIRAIFQPNMKQYGACNTGFAASTGDAVIFLDSDDMLDPELAREVAGLWRPGLSKVQVQMRVVDSSGTPTGLVLPTFRPMPTPARIRKWASKTTAYPTPPGSGNIYARWFLEKIFPLDGSCGAASDSYCLAAAPFAGDVLSICRPLVSYRRHGGNDSHFGTDKTRFSRELKRAELRFHYSCRFHPDIRSRFPLLFLKSLEVSQFRVCSFRLTPELHTVDNDTTGKILVDLILSAISASSVQLRKRFVILCWMCLVLVAPVFLSKRLIARRYG